MALASHGCCENSTSLHTASAFKRPGLSHTLAGAGAITLGGLVLPGQEPPAPQEVDSTGG